MYSEGANWKSWMKDFRFGTMVFLPDGEVREIGDKLRNQFDPVSANTCVSHITLTQPFTTAPDPSQISMIQSLIGSFSRFNAQIGPATTSPNKRLIWFDVEPKDLILELRGQLHETGLFRTDLPLTKGFIPHLTISEAQREPEEVNAINGELNERYAARDVSFESIVWIIPDDNFVFKAHRTFRLKSP